MNIHDFKKQFDELYNTMSGHKVPQTISFWCDGEELVPNEEEGLAGLTEDRLPGCGCSCGVLVNLKKEDLD